jgi:hypothetical protein
MQLKLVPTKNIHHKNSFDDKHIIFIPPKALEKHDKQIRLAFSIPASYDLIQDYSSFKNELGFQFAAFKLFW